MYSYKIRHRLARGGWQAWVEVDVPTRLDALDLARMRWPAARAWECRPNTVPTRNIP